MAKPLRNKWLVELSGLQFDAVLSAVSPLLPDLSTRAQHRCGLSGRIPQATTARRHGLW